LLELAWDCLLLLVLLGVKLMPLQQPLVLLPLLAALMSVLDFQLLQLHRLV